MKKVLLIDDNQPLLKVMTRMLERRGFDVMAFDNPLEFPAYTSTNCPCALCPDIIISDVDMPKVNGLQFVETVINKGCKCKHIALVTGKGLEEEDLHKMAKLNVRCFQKPFDLDEFDAWLLRTAM